MTPSYGWNQIRRPTRAPCRALVSQGPRVRWVELALAAAALVGVINLLAVLVVARAALPGRSDSVEY
jgi:hypothetical protein